jgi:tripartite-type tricarboxylate transporter receptor subunit TctC
MMETSMRRLARGIAILFVAATCIAPAVLMAQAFPNKPIRILVPYPAGGTTDLMARALQDPLQKALGQALVIENKPGASGIIAAREVARSAPDGHTLLFINSGIVAVTPFVVKDAGFDGVKDFSPIALVSTAPLLMVVNAAVPANDIKGFIEYAKQQSTPVEFASAGVGSFGHLASELFARTAGLKMTHVPYKGQAPTTNAVVAGEVKMLITTASAAMNGFIANGKLKLLGVTSPEPSPLAPGAPAVASALPGYAAETWFGFIAAAGTPADVTAKLNEAISRALEAPDMQKRFSGFGVLAKAASAKRVGEMIAEDVARWAPVIRDNNIRAD